MEQTPVPPLPYEPDAPAVRAGRRGYRLLVGLTLLNTLLFTGYFLGPPTYRAVRAAWDDRQNAARAKVAQQQAAQQARAAEQRELTRRVLAAERAAAVFKRTEEERSERQRRERQQWLDLLQPCRTHRFPAGTVAFEEAPAEAAALFAADNRYVRTSEDPNGDWAHPPVRLPPTDAWAALRDALEAAARATPANSDKAPELKLRQAGTPVFLHELTAPDGSKRLVVVLQRAWQGMVGAELEGRLTLTAYSVSAEAPHGQRPEVIAAAKPLEVYGGITRLDFAAPRPPGTPAPVRTHCMLRLYAGQPDPADDSHFTLEASIDGTPAGRIDGWLLADGTVKLAPSGGHVQEGSEAIRWRLVHWRERRRQRSNGR